MDIIIIIILIFCCCDSLIILGSGCGGSYSSAPEFINKYIINIK